MTPTSTTPLDPGTPVPDDVSVVGQWETNPSTGEQARRLHWVSDGRDGLSVVTACSQADSGELSNASVYCICDDVDGAEVGAAGARELAYKLTVAADHADRLNGSSSASF